MKIGTVHRDWPVDYSAVEGRKQSEQTKPAVRQGDSVEISDDARRKLANQADELLGLEQSSNPVYSRTDFKQRIEERGEDVTRVRSDLLKEVQHRIESGYYDRTEIKRMIAEKLANDIEP